MTLYIRAGAWGLPIWLYLLLLHLQYSNASIDSGGTLEKEVNNHQS